MKEYIYQHLNQPLQAGKVYCLSFYVNRSERTEYAVKQIGAYFSSSLSSTVGNMYINANPQVVSNVFVVDTIQWIEIQGCFTANGGEQYITIGNFNSNTNTDTLNLGTNNPISGWPLTSYYYIDDVTLIDQSTVGVRDMNDELGVMSVYPNPANDVLNIDLGIVKENTEIKITDLIGRKILVTEYKSQIDISFLEKGIYFISIQQDSKTLGVKNIIKQ